MYYIVHILLQLTFSTQHFAIEIFSWQCNQNNLIKKVVPQYHGIDFPFYLTILLLKNVQDVSSLLHASLCTRVRISLAQKWNCWFTRVYAFKILIDTAELSSKKIWPTPLPPHIFFHTLPHIFYYQAFLFFIWLLIIGSFFVNCSETLLIFLIIFFLLI